MQLQLFGIDMLDVSEGRFLMGADEKKEYDSEYEEQPERIVLLSSFQIQKTPVTVKQWQRFIDETAYEWSLQSQVAERSPLPDHPIIYVSWFDAYQFTEWLSESSGKCYSLPTEAQWEKACRGQHGQLFPWGNQSLNWVDEIPIYLETNILVGSRSEYQSPYGCLDMWQNVSEWCLDWFDDGDYFHDPLVKWSNPTGPELGELKVYRGGSPLTSGWSRCTYRKGLNPDTRHSTLGFRVVLNES
jgi:formylglycine-generating enzyme